MVREPKSPRLRKPVRPRNRRGRAATFSDQRKPGAMCHRHQPCADFALQARKVFGCEPSQLVALDFVMRTGKVAVASAGAGCNCRAPRVANALAASSYHEIACQSAGGRGVRTANFGTVVHVRFTLHRHVASARPRCFVGERVLATARLAHWHDRRDF